MNHTSWLDIVATMWTSCPSFLAKEEISRIPVIAQVSNSIQSVYVKRGDTKEKRAEIIKVILQRQLDAEKGLFPKLLIFPEGATTNGSCLIQFKKGAFLSLRSVQPLFIEYWNTTKVSTSMDVLGFGSHLAILAGCGFMTIKVYYMPDF
jgi:lysophosphatidylcholine acyltransferase/lyso-PAF acetyltransferase